ncbi:MAG: acetolactate synthase small subunit [Candidatus Porifericomitaceae bacterium WSBS_2022_MAG_OTU9]
MRHILSLLLENESGALSQVAGMFSARMFNIESLTVAPTEDPSLSRMTLVTSGSDQFVEQIIKLLNRLVNVVKVVDLSDSRHIERELLLVKLFATGHERRELQSLVEIFRGRIVDVTDTSFIVEMTGTSEKLEAFLAAVGDKSILEVVRSGASGIPRGSKSI